jgi:hypothetical protein
MGMVWPAPPSSVSSFIIGGMGGSGGRQDNDECVLALVGNATPQQQISATASI